MSEPAAKNDPVRLTTSEALQRAVTHHQAGQLPEAERCYRAILQAQPRHPDANHNLGVLILNLQQPTIALPFLRTALEVNPQSTQFWLSYIDGLLAAGDGAAARQVIAAGKKRGLPINLFAAAERAIDSLARRKGPAAASSREPQPPEVQRLTDLFNQGRYEEVEKLAQEMTRQFPSYGLGWNVLGAALHRRRRFPEAVGAAQKAVELLPNFAEVHSNLAAILIDLDRLQEAEAHCRRALELSPNFVQALLNLGGTLLRLGRLEEAEDIYRRILAVQPESLEALSDLGETLRKLGKLAESEICCRRAIALNEAFPEAHANLGNVLKDRDRLDEAVTSYRRAIQLRPTLVQAHTNLAGALKDLGQIDDALAHYRRTLEIDPTLAIVQSNLLFCLNYAANCSTAEVFLAHRRWGERQNFPVAAQLPANTDIARRLRVGYVSPDLRQHSIAYFIEPLLREHDRSAVEVFCYAEVARPDAVTSRLRGLSQHWRSTVGLSDDALARQIIDDRIDILVDLAGHTADNRLRVFARRPAPVQVTWLGYPNTTGLAAIDYRLVDDITDPKGDADGLATEQLIRLEKGFLCYGPPAVAPAPMPPPSVGKGFVTFGSFNNIAKLSPVTLDAWAALMERVPASRFLLKGAGFDFANISAGFLARLQSHGIDPGRVTLIGRTADQGEHLALYSQVDIALDSFPYNGTTTTCEALWMGVPVVALAGDRHASRVGASLLTSLGLTEFLADSVDRYIEIAATLAGEPERLAQLRENLRDRMVNSSLCDAPAFTRKLEATFRKMWEKACTAKAKTPRISQQERESLEVLFNQGRFAEVAERARTLTETIPGDGFGWNVLAVSLSRLGRNQEAVAPARRAVGLLPDSAEAHNNLGSIAQELGSFMEAETHFRRALALDRNYQLAHSNLAGDLNQLARFEEAAGSARRALELNPNDAKACVALGLALLNLRRLREAEASFRRALSISPDYVAAHSNLGGALHDLGRFAEAEASFRRALALAPNEAKSHGNVALILFVRGQLSEAIASYRHALALKPSYVHAHSNLLYSLNFLADISSAEVYAEHRRWNDVHGEGKARKSWAVEKEPSRRLRIGYVSPDLRRHPVAFFFEPLLRAHNRSAMEVFCYSGTQPPDEVTARLREMADHWIETPGLSDQEMAKRITDDRIDILVDLTGHTANNRLLVFAHKPAPVQVSWLGYPNTTGLRAMDYRLVDEITDPLQSADLLATERLIRLPQGFLCYSSPENAPPTDRSSRRDDGAVIFGSFNFTTKLSSATLAAWGELLQRVPRSRLLLKGKLFGDLESQPPFLARLRRHGIDPNRVDLQAWSAKRQEHLALYCDVDIALDPFPYNGTTTTCEAMWMGVPVITLLGDRHAARVGASLLSQVGLSEFVADSVETYVNIAAKLAADGNRLAQFRATLRERMAKSSLCDATAFAQKVEEAYRKMWQTFCATDLDALAT